MKIIRWPGLIAFLIITTALIAGTVLFAGSIIKSIAESTLTDMNKARVDIASVDINYSPLSLSVNDIQITDSTSPMINALQIGQAHFALSFSDLLLKKVIIDDMSLSNIRIDTPRKRSGAIETKTTKENVTDNSPLIDISMPDMEMPKVDDVLKNTTLQSPQTIALLSQDLDKTHASWTQLSNDILNSKRWYSHEARYQKISTDFKGDYAQKIASIKEAKKLREDYAQEVTRIQNARKQINADSSRLDEEYKAARAAPGKDIDSIKQQYKLDDLSAGNITQLLFGQQAAEYLALARTWYLRLKPYLPVEDKNAVKEKKMPRLKGEDITFREFNPKPDFYIRKAAIDAEVPRGKFAGEITEVSSSQSISGKPTKFLLKGQDMRHRDSEQLSGEFNYVNKSSGYSDFSYNIKAYQLKDVSISRSDKLSLKMSKSLMNFDLSTRLQSGQISGRSDILFNQVQFDSNTQSSGTLARMLATSFSDVHRFNINTQLKGDFKNMDMSLKSDLDKQIGAQFKTQMQQQKQKFEVELKSRIDETLREPMAKIEAKKQQLDSVKQQINDKEKELTQKLADLNSKIDQEKNLQNDKLQDKKDEKKESVKKGLLNKLKL